MQYYHYKGAAHFERERQFQRTASASHLRLAWEKWLSPASQPAERQVAFELILDLLRFRAMVENTEAFFKFLYQPGPEPVCLHSYSGQWWGFNPYGR